MFFVLHALIILCFLIDLRSIFVLSGKFVVKELEDSSSATLAKTLGFTSLWAVRALIFQYVLLVPTNSLLLRCVSTLFFLFPTLLAIYLIGFRRYLSDLVLLLRSNLTSLTLVFAFSQVIVSAGETSWDGSSYHLPIELFIQQQGSVWGWPDLIYSQWQLSGIEAIFALYGIAFDSLRIALIVSLFLFCLLLKIFVSLIPSKKFQIVVVLFSVPALFHQVGTRYIDSIIAIMSFVGIVLLKEKKVANHFRFGIYITAFPILAVAFSGKWTAVTSEFAAFVAITILTIEKRKDLFQATRQGVLIVFAFFVGVLPISLRNFLEWDNPIFPYTVLNFKNGYFSLGSYSSDLSKLYSSQIGLTDTPHFVKIFVEYISTPFLALVELVKFVFSFNVNDLLSRELIYRTFVYDNRLSGFGPSFIILILLYLFTSVHKLYRKLVFILTITGLTFLPSFIHSRYYLTIFLVLVWFMFENLDFKKYRFKNLSKLFILSILSFAVANVATSAHRLLPSGLGIYPVDQSTVSTARKVNPDCSNVYHVGSGLWGVSALWGKDFCGKPIEGENVNGALFGSKIGDPQISAETLENLSRFAGNDAIPSKRIVCSFPKNAVNPCDEVILHLSSKKDDLVFTRSGVISEYPTGPNLESIKILMGNS